jgi:outer membrane protein assembly factor BamD (BamD/ComL family)
MEQFVYVGQWFLDAERQAEALDAFSFVLQSKTEDRTLLERALYGAGQAQYAMKDFAAAAATLNNLLTRYPNSGLFFEAKLMMGRALREQGRMDEAIAALSDVFKYGTEPVLINRANLDLADIYRGMAAKAKAGGDADLAGEQLRAASAAYQRIVLLSPRRSAALREMVEQAALGGIPTFMEMGKFREAVEMCDTFLAEFPQSTSVQQVRTWRAESMVTASLQAPAPTPAPRK